MKKIILFCLLSLFIIFGSFSIARASDVTANITSDTTWTLEGAPYYIYSDIAVEAGATLKIEPGVSVLFDTGEISVYGSIVAEGSTFGGLDGESWIGISLHQGSKGVFKSVQIENAFSGISLYGGNLDIQNSVIKNNIFGLDLDSGTANFSGNTFEANNVLAYMEMSASVTNDNNISLNNDFDGILIGTKYVPTFHASFNDDLPYIPVGNFGVFKESSLVLGPGVIIKSPNMSSYLDMSGNVSWQGTKDRPVVFSSLDPDGVWGALGIYGGVKNVGYIKIENSRNGVDINNTTINGSFDIKDSYMGLNIFKSNGQITDSKFINTNMPIGVGRLSNIKVSDTSIKNIPWSEGIYVTASSLLEVNNVEITDSLFSPGIVATNGAKVQSNGNKLSGLARGIFVYNGTLTGENNTIKQNQIGLQTKGTSTITFKNNWWGSESGPKAIDNIGGLGDEVIGTTNYKPWLTADPTNKPPITFFIPGLEASRLYTNAGGIEKKLWEPSSDSDLKILYLDTDGKSIDKNVYAKDIIDELDYPIISTDIYKNFISYLGELKSKKVISDFYTLPYDWRFSPDKIANTLLGQIENISKQNISSRINIVTHSNGGFVAKMLMNILNEKNDEISKNILSRIENIIMISAPERGTPEALAVSLHGYGFRYLGGLLAKESTARAFAENMESAYSLLPSEQYLASSEGVIEFDPTVDLLGKYRDFYGDEVENIAEMNNFILANEGRTDPAHTEINKPNILNSILLSRADEIREQMNKFSLGTNLYRIVGWGKDTVNKIVYSAKSSCLIKMFCKEYEWRYKTAKSPAGDGTVMLNSRVDSSNTYFFDLYSYSKDEKNTSHSNITEARPVEDLIGNIFSKKVDLPKYISENKPIYAIKSIEIGVHSPVELHLYDGNGRHTGKTKDENGLVYYEENIVGSKYEEIGEEKYINVPDGNYNVELYGEDFGVFSLDVTKKINGEVDSSMSWNDLPVTPILKAQLTVGDSSDDLKIDVDGDGNNDYEISSGSQFDYKIHLGTVRKVISTLSIPEIRKNKIMENIDRVEMKLIDGQIERYAKSLEKNKKEILLGKGRMKKEEINNEREKILNSWSRVLDEI